MEIGQPFLRRSLTCVSLSIPPCSYVPSVVGLTQSPFGMNAVYHRDHGGAQRVIQRITCPPKPVAVESVAEALRI